MFNDSSQTIFVCEIRFGNTFAAYDKRYIIGHYNPSVRIIDQDYSFIHHLCYVLILYISGGTYSLKSTPNNRFFEELFMAILFTHRVSTRNLLRGNHRGNTFCILFWCLARGPNPGFTSIKRETGFTALKKYYDYRLLIFFI